MNEGEDGNVGGDVKVVGKQLINIKKKKEKCITKRYFS